MNYEDHPLANAFGDRNLDIRVDRVLILEWLPPGDRRTGNELAAELRDKGAHVDYVSCASKDEVINELGRIVSSIADRGVPIIHVEAHGEDAVDGTPRGFIGPDSEGEGVLLSWEELGDKLRPINLETRFNLLVVGAACYGEGLMLTLEPGKPMPFVAVVGYTGKVSTLSLRHALARFYDLLIINKKSLSEAIDEANREHYFETDSVLRETSAARLVLESFVDTFSGTSPSAMVFLTRAQRAAIERMALEEGWKVHFAMNLIPENADRFRIDIDEVLRVARTKPIWDE